MSSRVEIVVSGEAVALARPRFRYVKPKSGDPFVHTYNPAHVSRWQSHARLCAQQAMGERPPFDEPVRAKIIVVLPIPKSFSKRQVAQAMCGSLRPAKRPDLDNYVKAALDACMGIAFRDDSLIVSLWASKVYGAKPQMQIIIEPIGLTASEEQRGLFHEKA